VRVKKPVELNALVPFMKVWGSNSTGYLPKKQTVTSNKFWPKKHPIVSPERSTGAPTSGGMPGY